MSQLDRLLSRVVVTDEGCWLYNGAVDRGGYGSIKVDGKSTRAHRTAYRLLVGPIPPSKHLCHTCDTPGCINPAHLWLGTNAENMADRNAKGRQAKGEHNGRAKLTADAVRAIRCAAERDSKAELARRFGISYRDVSKILAGEIWRDA